MGKPASEGLPAVRVVSSGRQDFNKDSINALNKQQRHQQLLEFQTTLHQLKQARDTDALMLQNLRAELDILRRREYQEKRLEEDNDRLKLELLDAQQEILILKQQNAELQVQNDLKQKQQQEVPATAPLPDEEAQQEMRRIKNKVNKAIAKADKYKAKNQELEEKLRFYMVQKSTTEMVTASATMQGLDPAQLQEEAIAARKERPRSRSRRRSPAKDEPKKSSPAKDEPKKTESIQDKQPPMTWEEYFDPSQQKSYYVNTTTGVSQWEKPPEFKQEQPEAPIAQDVPKYINIDWAPPGKEIDWVPPPVDEIRIGMPAEHDVFAGQAEDGDPAPRNPRKIPFPRITSKVHQWDDQVKAVRAKEQQEKQLVEYDAESESEKTSEPSLEPPPKPIVKMLGRAFFVQESPAEAWKRRKEAQKLKKENRPMKEKKSRIVFEKKPEWTANKLRDAPQNDPNVPEFLRKFHQIGLHNENVVEATGKVEVKSGVMVTAKGVTYSGQAAIEKAAEDKRLREEEERRLEEEEEARWEKEEEERRQREEEEEEEERRRRDEEAEKVREQREREIKEREASAAKAKAEQDAKEKEEQEARKKAEEEAKKNAEEEKSRAAAAAAPPPPAAPAPPPPQAAAPAPPPAAAPKKKSFLDSSTSDDSDSPVLKKATATAAPAKKKKSFLDSSSSDDSS